jgi:hypothetical protein
MLFRWWSRARRPCPGAIPCTKLGDFGAFGLKAGSIRVRFRMAEV